MQVWQRAGQGLFDRHGPNTESGSDTVQEVMQQLQSHDAKELCQT